MLKNGKKVADEFQSMCNFPLCLGAMDGKHVMIEASNYSGSEYYNYKGYFSVVLLLTPTINFCT